MYSFSIHIENDIPYTPTHSNNNNRKKCKPSIFQQCFSFRTRICNYYTKHINLLEMYVDQNRALKRALPFMFHVYVICSNTTFIFMVAKKIEFFQFPYWKKSISTNCCHCVRLNYLLTEIERRIHTHIQYVCMYVGYMHKMLCRRKIDSYYTVLLSYMRMRCFGKYLNSL